MGVIVYTESECDVCHKKHCEKGARGTCPSVGWASASLTYRQEGSGWTNNKQYEAILCPDCAQRVSLILQEGVKCQK